MVTGPLTPCESAAVGGSTKTLSRKGSLPARWSEPFPFRRTPQFARFASELMPAESRSTGQAMELHILERAFELAKAGDCASIDDIRRRLKAEKYSQVDA